MVPWRSEFSEARSTRSIRSIDNIKGKSTIVIVAHRLTTIKNVDKIFYLENGEIVDVGTFDELYKRNKSFKTMFLAENI